VSSPSRPARELVKSRVDTLEGFSLSFALACPKTTDDGFFLFLALTPSLTLSLSEVLCPQTNDDGFFFSRVHKRPTNDRCSLSRSLALSLSRSFGLSRSLALSRKRLTVGSLSLAHSLSHEHPKMGSLALSFSLSLALSLRISTTGWQRLSTVVPCRHVVSGPNDRRWVFSPFLTLFLSSSISLSRSHSLSPSRSLALAFSLSLFVSSQPRLHRWKLSTRAVRASERAMAATTARGSVHAGTHEFIVS